MLFPEKLSENELNLINFAEFLGKILTFTADVKR